MALTGLINRLCYMVRNPPALREGRIVVTNIEGLKPKEFIEELLGEKFPDSARLIVIFTRSSEGVMLWQNWFNWMPLGAFK